MTEWLIYFLLAIPEAFQLTEPAHNPTVVVVEVNSRSVFVQWNFNITNPHITKTPAITPKQTIFFSPVIVKCMEKNPI